MRMPQERSTQTRSLELVPQGELGAYSITGARTAEVTGSAGATYSVTGSGSAYCSPENPF